MANSKNYDVIIVGAGPAGFFMAYELSKLNTNLEILVIEKGVEIKGRRCPILLNVLTKCPVDKKGYHSCHPVCAITSGFGGSGAYSDGKFNITAEFGGWMTDYLDKDEILDLINYVDKVNVEHGATEVITDPTIFKVKEIERKGLSVGLKLLKANVKHLGTEENLKIMDSIYQALKEKVDFKFKTDVSDIIVENKTIKGVILANGEKIESKYVFIAPGREGAAWLDDVAIKNGLKVTNNQIDIGVRVETNDLIMEEINENLYEGKFIFNTSLGTVARTFCSNPSGHVVMENHNGVILANGHAFNNPKLGSKNTNFAILVSHFFEDELASPNDYGFNIGLLANRLTKGSIIIQKYGDMKAGRKTTLDDLKKGFVEPTLKKAVPGDLGLVLPYKTQQSIIEMLEALDKITPGIASEHTLLYGVETKFYSARPKVDKNFETEIKNLFLGGDGAGITRGLAQASANGVYVARVIADRITPKKATTKKKNK